MKRTFVISRYANHNDITTTLINNNPGNKCFFFVCVCGPTAILTSLSSSCPTVLQWSDAKPSLPALSLEADKRTKWSVQGAAIFLHSHPVLRAAVHRLFSRGQCWAKREAQCWLVSQWEMLLLRLNTNKLLLITPWQRLKKTKKQTFILSERLN